MKLFFFYSTNDQFSLSVVSVSTGLVQYIVFAMIVVAGWWCDQVPIHSTPLHFIPSAYVIVRITMIYAHLFQFQSIFNYVSSFSIYKYWQFSPWIYSYKNLLFPFLCIRCSGRSIDRAHRTLFFRFRLSREKEMKNQKEIFILNNKHQHNKTDQRIIHQFLHKLTNALLFQLFRGSIRLSCGVLVYGNAVRRADRSMVDLSVPIFHQKII